jgi:hypothetical protein
MRATFTGGAVVSLDETAEGYGAMAELDALEVVVRP